MACGKDAKMPTVTELVSWTNVEFEKGTINAIVFPHNLSATERTLTLERSNGDDFVHLHEWQWLSEIKADETPN